MKFRMLLAIITIPGMISFSIGSSARPGSTGVAASHAVLVEGARLGDAMVLSGTGRLTVRNVLVDSLSDHTKSKHAMMEEKAKAEGRTMTPTVNLTSQISFTFSGPKFRTVIDSHFPMREGYIQHWEYVWDGENTGLLRLDSEGINGLIRPGGSVFGTRISYPFSNPLDYGMTIRGVSVAGFLSGETASVESDAERTVNLHYIGEKTIDGVACKGFTGKGEPSGKMVTAWIAPERMYRPVQVETVSPEEITVIHTQFRPYQNDIWFPANIDYKLYYIDERSGRRVLERQVTMKVHDDFKINITVPDSVFVPRFEKGMVIGDARRNTSYTVK